MNLNNFIWIDALLDVPLSNGENRSFISFTYQKLFKKYPRAFFFGMGSNTVIYIMKSPLQVDMILSYHTN